MRSDGEGSGFLALSIESDPEKLEVLPEYDLITDFNIANNENSKSGEVKVDRFASTLNILLTNVKRFSSSKISSLVGFEDVKRRSLEGEKTKREFTEHMLPIEVLADKFLTQIDFADPTKSKGLPSKKAADLLASMGPNVLTPPPKVPLWLIFLLQFTNLLMVLLMITGLLCIILYIIAGDPANLYIGVLLFIVVLVTCVETFHSEVKSDSLMEQFRALVPESAAVIRDGVLQPLDSTQLVIGDIIRLKAGDKVPADCRVIFNESMKVSSSDVLRQ